jgi:hypothetical protein
MDHASSARIVRTSTTASCVTQQRIRHILVIDGRFSIPDAGFTIQFKALLTMKSSAAGLIGELRPSLQLCAEIDVGPVVHL